MLSLAPEWHRAFRVLFYVQANDTSSAAVPRIPRSDPKKSERRKERWKSPSKSMGGSCPLRSARSCWLSGTGQTEQSEALPGASAVLGRARVRRVHNQHRGPFALLCHAGGIGLPAGNAGWNSGVLALCADTQRERFLLYGFQLCGDCRDVRLLQSFRLPEHHGRSQKVFQFLWENIL